LNARLKASCDAKPAQRHVQYSGVRVSEFQCSRAEPARRKVVAERRTQNLVKLSRAIPGRIAKTSGYQLERYRLSQMQLDEIEHSLHIQIPFPHAVWSIGMALRSSLDSACDTRRQRFAARETSDTPNYGA
jgi:hypothetical protein